MAKIPAFFYGLFMDPELLYDQGLCPSTHSIAKLADYKFILGERASMVPQSGDEAWGTIMFLDQFELDRLYGEPSVKDYRPTNVVCEDHVGDRIPAKTYILPLDYPLNPPETSEYAQKLLGICKKLGLPDTYCDKIEIMIAEIDKDCKE